MDTADYTDLAELWEISLRSAGLSHETIRSYLAGVRKFAAFCATAGTDPELALDGAERFLAALGDLGQSPNTAVARWVALRAFSAWLLERQETTSDPLVKLKKPKLDKPVVDYCTPAQLDALVATCLSRRFIDVRDLALIRFMTNTGARAEEIIGLRVIDVQIGAGSAVVVRGKGGKGRRVGFGLRTADALGRYARARRKHPLAERPEFWLAERSRVLSYDGLYATLTRRAGRAGIDPFFPHMLRHTMAVSWARAGGSTTGLMAQGGWSSVDLVRRYIGAAQSELAVEESQRLGLDDF